METWLCLRSILLLATVSLAHRAQPLIAPLPTSRVADPFADQVLPLTAPTLTSVALPGPPAHPIEVPSSIEPVDLHAAQDLPAEDIAAHDRDPAPPLDGDGVEAVPEAPPVIDGKLLENEHLERARKAEASSLRHLMTHHPKNQYCNTCCIAKIQRAPHRRKQHKYWKGKPKPAVFGDQVTADHIIAYSDRSMGVTGHQAAVIYGDRATGYFDGFPIMAKTTLDTSDALRKWMGSEGIKRAWSDNSPELIATFRESKIVHDLSTQGQPQSNGRAERLVRRTMEGTKTLTLQAGLPGAFWPYAMRHYCFSQNIDVVGGDSNWNRRHGLGQFDGPSIPFGCLVDFKPMKEDSKLLPKGSPGAVPGVFLGYKLNPGGVWQGEYRVADLTEFNDLDLSVWGNSGDIHHQVVREIVWSPKSIIFPLRKKYDYVNRTLEGIEGVPFVPDPDAVFSELQEGPLPVPAADEVVSDPVVPPVPVVDPTDHGRVIRGTEIVVDGKRYREDASGRRYLLDESGSIRRKNTTRPPYIPDDEWRMYDKALRTKLTSEWKLSVAQAVDGEIRRVASGLPHSVPPVGGQPSSSSSSSAAPPANSSGLPSSGASGSACAVPAACVESLREARAWRAMNGSSGGDDELPFSESDSEPDDFRVPAMPVIFRPPGYKAKHRDKIADFDIPVPACVARAVSKSEIALTPAAQAAMDVEFNKLRDKIHPGLKKKGCWDEDEVQEFHTVKERARVSGKTTHFGRIFGICVEKGSELPLGDPGRKFKGRFVFQGNEVKDQNWEAAVFQELGSSPAAMEAGNSCDFYGLLPGHRSEQSDAEQAYTQSLLKGTDTWVFLPRDRWPAS